MTNQEQEKGKAMTDTNTTEISITNDTENTPLPPAAGYYRLSIKDGDTHTVYVTAEPDIRIRPDGDETWNNTRSILPSWNRGHGWWKLTPMADEEVKPDVSVIPGGIYRLHGRLCEAISTTSLVLFDLTNEDSFPAVDGVELVYEPGSLDWTSQMMLRREKADRTLRHYRESDARWQRQYEDLGQALLEQAEERDWCSEYDEFADEWDLPRRKRPYEVTMTVTVLARNEDEAEEMVEPLVHIQSYDEGVEYGPHFDANEA